MSLTSFRSAIIALLSAALGACGVLAPKPAPEPVALSALPGWASDDISGVADAIGQQCAKPATVSRLPDAWQRLCPEFARIAGNDDALREWLATTFVAWPLLDDAGSDRGLVTGYFEPLLTGSRKRESPAQVALYRKPEDLLTIDLAAVEPRLAGMRLRGRLEGQRVIPYWSRADIEGGKALAGQELVWVDDPVDAFFLQIQGSGRVRLRDGSVLRVGYADQNGHPYRAIGRDLVERGALKAGEVTAPAIRDWLRDNPKIAPEVMNRNASYVFFRELPAPVGAAERLGPPGSLGVPLTPLRAIAVDRRVVPLGSLVWLDTAHPVSNEPLRRLVAAQDTGGAITGRIRADLFWGFGDEAARAAGLMKHPGRMWILWPRGAVPPSAAATKAGG